MSLSGFRVPAPVAHGSVGSVSSLATPLRLGQVALRNRVVFSAHLTNFASVAL